MKRFLLKAAALALVCFNTTQITAADTVTVAGITIDLDQITTELPAAKVPFAAYVLDFSNPTAIAESTTGLVLTLATNSKTLTVPHVLYLLCEGLAAESRAKPDSLGGVSQFLNTHTTTNKSAVYEAFEKINGSIQLGSSTLTTIFASQDSCNAFVIEAANKVVPAILKNMGAGTDITQLVVLGTSVATPIISQALFEGYTRSHQVLQNVHLETIGKNVVSSSGGCFGCGGKKKQK